MLGFLWFVFIGIILFMDYCRKESLRMEAKNKAAKEGKEYYDTDFGHYYKDKKAVWHIINGHEVLTSVHNKNIIYVDLTAEAEERTRALRIKLEEKEREAIEKARLEGRKWCSLTNYASNILVVIDVDTHEFYGINTNGDLDVAKFVPYVKYVYERIWNDEDCTYRWKCVDSIPITEKEMYELGAYMKQVIYDLPTKIGEISYRKYGVSDIE